MITIRGLEKAFGELRAVGGVDLAVEPGRLLVLLGQNGAGKSTTLRCAGGVLQPDAGEVRFGNLELPRDVDLVRRRLGVVPDQARLYGRNTAFEYLDHFGHLHGLAPAERRPRIRELLERFDLAGRDRQPLATYSRGMAQKVSLIRATLHRPDWIFCDEPTSGLDPVASAEMRTYLDEQRRRGAALVVTTHILSEAELMADRLAVMRAGRVVAAGTLDELRRQSFEGRRFELLVPGATAASARSVEWLARTATAPVLEGERLSFGLPWDWDEPRVARLAAELQQRLAAAGTPYARFEEAPATLESIYLRAMAAPQAASSDGAVTRPWPRTRAGVAATVGSLRRQPALIRHLLPFYVSSWWRRGDLSWVAWLNAFVLLVIAGASLFGSLPAGATRLVAGVGPSALGAGVLLPLFFMSFALLESIKTSIGIWWEKAQSSLEVLLYAPLRDPDLVWIEVLPGAVVSGVWITAWMTIGLGLMTAFGRPAPWGLLPVFAFVAVATAYWAAMGRLLGFLLFPREGAAGGAWSFLLSPISAAVADLPLALFVFGSPLAPMSLLLPVTACLAMTLLVGASFDRERLLETGVVRERPRRRRDLTPLRRRAMAVGAALAAAAVLAGVAAVVVLIAGAHSWADVRHIVAGGSAAPVVAAASTPPHVGGAVTIAAAIMGGVVAALAAALVLLALTFAAFFLCGAPQLVVVAALAAAWGAEAGFGPAAPLAPWFALAGGVLVLAAVVNLGAAVPVYTALVTGKGDRITRVRAAWSDYFAIFRLAVLPLAGLFGVVVAALLALD